MSYIIHGKYRKRTEISFVAFSCHCQTLLFWGNIKKFFTCVIQSTNDKISWKIEQDWKLTKAHLLRLSQPKRGEIIFLQNSDTKLMPQLNNIWGWSQVGIKHRCLRLHENSFNVERNGMTRNSAIVTANKPSSQNSCYFQCNHHLRESLYLLGYIITQIPLPFLSIELRLFFSSSMPFFLWQFFCCRYREKNVSCTWRNMHEWIKQFILCAYVWCLQDVGKLSEASFFISLAILNIHEFIEKKNSETREMLDGFSLINS